MTKFSETELFSALEYSAKALGASEEDVLEFARCMRPNGTFYGTRGKCRKGSEAGEPEPSQKKAKVVGSLGSKKKEVYNKLVALKGEWSNAATAEKTATKQLSQAVKDYRKDKNPENLARVRKAETEAEKANRNFIRVQDRFFKVKKKLSLLTMTPEQRREEREWDKTKKSLG